VQGCRLKERAVGAKRARKRASGGEPRPSVAVRWVEVDPTDAERDELRRLWEWLLGHRDSLADTCADDPD
jgi:hypothetical protein